MRTATNEAATLASRPGIVASLAVLAMAAAACSAEGMGDDSMPPDPGPAPTSATTTTRTGALSAVGRLYFKFNGKIAIGVDSDGNLFSPTVELSATGGAPFTAFPGIVFKQNGTALYGIKQDNPSDIDQLGQLVIRNDFVAELVSSMPLPGETGVLLFKSSGVAKMEFDHLDHNGDVLLHNFFVRSFKYRKNALFLNPTEKKNYVDAVLNLTTQHYGGQACNTVGTNLMLDPTTGANVHPRMAGGVNYFGKFDEIHSDTMSHGGEDFLPWHRELLNRLEAQLRAYDPTISIPYWDWSSSASFLWTSDFMGVVNSQSPDPDGGIGAPWKGAIYNPGCVTTCIDAGTDPCGCANSCRPDDAMMNPYYNAAFLPKVVTRTGTPDTVWGGNCNNTDVNGNPVVINSDFELIHFADQFAQADQYRRFLGAVTCPHGLAHSMIGGTMEPPATSARDPFFYLLHANVDRLWTTWQSDPNYPWRKNTSLAGTVNGVYGNDVNAGGLESVTFALEPWADVQATNGTAMYRHIRPYADPARCTPSTNCTGEHADNPAKTSTDASIVLPVLYDAL
jgi:hypothetical protein